MVKTSPLRPWECQLSLVPVRFPLWWIVPSGTFTFFKYKSECVGGRGTGMSPPTVAHKHTGILRQGGLPCSCSLVGEKPGGLELFSRLMVWEPKGGPKGDSLAGAGGQFPQ